MKRLDRLTVALVFILLVVGTLAWHDLRALAYVAFVVAWGVVAVEFVTIVRRPPPEPAAKPETQSPAEFKQYCNDVIERGHWVDVTTVWATLIAVLAVMLEVYARVPWPLPFGTGAMIGVNLGMTVLRHLRIRHLKAVMAQFDEATAVLDALGMRGGVFVGLVVDEDIDVVAEIDPIVRPGHPMWDLIVNASDHGHAAMARIVRTEDGLEVLHASFPDGTEYGPHEPPHEERA